MTAGSAEIEQIMAMYGLVETALSGEDVESYIAQCTEDVEFIPIMALLEGRVYRGHDGVRQWLEDLRYDWEMFKPIPDSVEALGGGHFLVLGRWDARARGSGVELEGQPAAWLMHRRDGKVARLQTFTNREEALEAAERIRSAAPDA